MSDHFDDTIKKVQPATSFGTAGSAENMALLGYSQPAPTALPAPAPLPEEVERALVYIRENLPSQPRYITDFDAAVVTMLSAFTAQARRLAEVEAENGNLILALMGEQERTEHLSSRHMDAAVRAEAAEAKLKRYREALESIKDEVGHMDTAIEIARKALEEEQ